MKYYATVDLSMNYVLEAPNKKVAREAVRKWILEEEPDIEIEEYDEEED